MIGSEIVRRQEVEGWKDQVIDRLCKDIQSDFPGLKGFSRSKGMIGAGPDNRTFSTLIIENEGEPKCPFVRPGTITAPITGSHTLHDNNDQADRGLTWLMSLRSWKKRTSNCNGRFA